MNEENLFLLGDYLSDPIIRLLAKLCVFKKRTSTRLAKIRQPSTGDDIGVIRKASKSILYTSILLSFPIPVKLHHRILWRPQSALEIDNEIPITKDIQDASTGIIYNILGDIDESILAEYIGEDNVEKLSESGYRILALTIKLLESYRYSLPENIIELLENFIRNYAKLNMKYRTQYLEAGRIIASLVGLAGYIYNNEINPLAIDRNAFFVLDPNENRLKIYGRKMYPLPLKGLIKVNKVLDIKINPPKNQDIIKSFESLVTRVCRIIPYKITIKKRRTLYNIWIIPQTYIGVALQTVLNSIRNSISPEYMGVRLLSKQPIIKQIIEKAGHPDWFYIASVLDHLGVRETKDVRLLEKLCDIAGAYYIDNKRKSEMLTKEIPKENFTIVYDTGIDKILEDIITPNSKIKLLVRNTYIPVKMIRNEYVEFAHKYLNLPSTALIRLGVPEIILPYNGLVSERVYIVDNSVATSDIIVFSLWYKETIDSKIAKLEISNEEPVVLDIIEDKEKGILLKEVQHPTDADKPIVTNKGRDDVFPLYRIMKRSSYDKIESISVKKFRFKRKDVSIEFTHLLFRLKIKNEPYSIVYIS